MAESKLMVRKTDFNICGCNAWTEKENTHVPCTFSQARWIESNPAVNGPKFMLFYMTSTGMTQDVKDAAFMDMLRKEQNAQDKGAPSVPAAVADVAPVVEKVAEKAPELNEGVENVRAMLMAMDDKAAIIDYSVKTLGQKLGLDLRYGKDRIVNAICDELGKAK